MYHQAAILVTTFCNRTCPECCYRIPGRETLPTIHYDWPYFERAATFLRGLAVLCISGGEPTLHPQFGRILREFDALFEPDVLELVTNGCDLPRYADDWHHLARITIADFPGDERSHAAVAALRAWDPSRVTVYDGTHRSLTRRGSGAPCGRRTIAAYAAGRLYPCCVSPGIPGAASMEPARDWREALEQVPLACADCCFSPSKLEEVAA
jgi:hypothetical protein